MSTLTPLSTSSTTSSESSDSTPILRHKHDSDKSDESEDSRYLNVSEHQDRISHSPAASYISMKSDQSMKAPLKFRHEPDVTPTSPRDELSPCLTVASFSSMEPPVKFAILRDPHTHQMIKGHLKCTMCLDVFKEPVTIPCGHSFCKSCILAYWTAQIGNYSCPECRKRFAARPALKLNVTLANVVQMHQRAGFSHAVPVQSYAGPGDVACGICTRSKIRAVKTCLTCSVSYCEAHVRKHYTVEALQKHVLMEPTKDLKQGGGNKQGKANTSAEVTVPKDLMSNLMKHINQLQNHVNDMALKLEDIQRSKTEDKPPRKRSRGQLRKEWKSDMHDFAEPDYLFKKE